MHEWEAGSEGTLEGVREESREGWDVTWVWGEVFKGQDERKKI